MTATAILILGGLIFARDWRFSSLLPTSGSTPVRINSGLVFGAGILVQQGPRFCREIQDYGSKFSWLTLSWQRVEPKKGEWNWNQFDNWVNGFSACGQEVAVHVLSDATWAIKPIPISAQNSRHKPSMPAINSQDYYNFIFNIASHYKGKITRYSIENEAHAAQNWGGTPEEYMTELQTAYKAIKSADPSAIVEDAAMSHEGLGYLTTAWLYQKGQIQQAMDFANAYDVHFQRGSQSLKISNPSQLSSYLNNPGIQNLIKWENLLFANHQYYDYMQIHNGAPWQSFQTVLDYVHTNLQAHGDDKKLDLWETWYSWAGAPGNGFDPKTQADEIVKAMTVAFANQVVVYNYWTFDDSAISEGHPGLVDNQGNPRLAAIAFKIASQKLSGSSSIQSLNHGPNIFAYKFDNNGKEVFVVWSIGTTSISLPLPGKVSVTDLTGARSVIDSVAIPVGSSPVFIE